MKYTTYEYPHVGGNLTKNDMERIYTKEVDKSEYITFADWLADMLRSGVFEGGEFA